MLPDPEVTEATATISDSLNAPTGAWCSLTTDRLARYCHALLSQCTYRCVVLPDLRWG